MSKCTSFMCGSKRAFVDENSWAKLIVNRDEISKGHLLIYPKKHSKNFSDLEKDDWKNGIIPLLKKGVSLLGKNKDIVGFHINHNAEGYASEGHTHFHIIPKYKNGEGFSCGNDEVWKKLPGYKCFESATSNIFDNWINYFDEIKNHIKDNSTITSFNLFARIGKVDKGKYQHDHLHFIPYSADNGFKWRNDNRRNLSLYPKEWQEITEKIKKGEFGSTSSPTNPNPSNPNGGGKNANDIEDTKFLQNVIYNFAGYSDYDLGEKTPFPNTIWNLWNNNKFEEIEIYRNKLIKLVVEKKSASASSDEVNGLKKRIWERFEKDSTLLKTKSAELKKFLEIKNDNNSPDSNQPNNNRPTNNSNNNDTSDPKKNNPPNDNQENKDKPDNSPSELPILDTKKITNAENIETAQTNAQQHIQALFTKSKIKPSDLEPSLWKNKSSWEVYLKELKTNQEILEFTQLLASKIKEKQQSRQNKKNFSPSSNSSNKSKILAWSVGSGILLAILISLVFTLRQRVIRKRKRKRVK